MGDDKSQSQIDGKDGPTAAQIHYWRLQFYRADYQRAQLHQHLDHATTAFLQTRKHLYAILKHQESKIQTLSMSEHYLRAAVDALQQQVSGLVAVNNDLVLQTEQYRLALTVASRMFLERSVVEESTATVMGVVQDEQDGSVRAEE